MILVVPGFVICITPPQPHMSLLVLFSAGCPAISTVGLPGAHGAVVKGMHGIGVRAPSAAAVAEATVGLPRHEHIPNGSILIMGLLSMIFASGVDVSVLFCGSTTMDDGAIPNEHASIAPIHTANAIVPFSFRDTYRVRSAFM